MSEILVATGKGKIFMVSPEPEKAADPPRLLARGHLRGPIVALASHPSGDMILTGGFDGQLLLWEVETGNVVGEANLPHGITYVNYHYKGDKIAVCMRERGGYIVSQTPQRKLAITSYRFLELVKTELTLAKYSPECDMIVVAFRSKIEIYNSDSIKNKIQSLVGHEGLVRNVDWATDGKYLVSTSDSYELIFWDRYTGRPILASSVANLYNPQNEPTWATWSCFLGWVVQGISSSQPDEAFITSVCKDSSSSLVVVGDADGGMSLYPYPCPESCIPVRPPNLHVGPVLHAIFLGRYDAKEHSAKEHSLIVSLGAADSTVLIWRLEKAAPRVEFKEVEKTETTDLLPEIQRIILESRATALPSDGFKKTEGTDVFEAVKPYLMNVCPPSEPVTPPEEFHWQVDLQHLHGFQGASGRASAFVSDNGEVVYAAGATCIVQIPDAMSLGPGPGKVQRHFIQHTDHIHCMACHPNGLVIASSDGQPNSKILLWKIDSLQIVAELATESNEVALLSFSGGDGTVLVAVSNEDSHTISAWDWRKQELLGIEDGDFDIHNRILSVAVDPFGTADKQMFLTCGVNHVKFWTLEKNTDRRGYLLKSLRGQIQSGNIMLCAQGCRENNYVTGTSKGELYLWKEEKVLSIVEGHDGPVFALSGTLEKLCSASNDAFIKIWDHVLRPLHTIQLRDHLDNTFLDMTLRGANPSVCSLDWSGKHDRILVGTTAGELFDVSYRKGSIESVQFHAHGHGTGKILALCSHPKELLVACGGEDKSIRLWELGEVPSLFCILTCRSIITALEFSPGDGSMLAFAHDDGSIRILDTKNIVNLKVKTPVPCDQLLLSVQPPKKRRVPVEVLRFSPNTQYLAAGCTNGCIDLFSVDEEFKLIGVCKGHVGAISQLDFDLGGNHLQSNTWSDELKFWDIPECVETKRSTDLCDSEWASFTCRLAWHVLAFIPTGNESSLRSICRQNSKPATVIAAGFASGCVKLMPFPAPEPEFGEFTLHHSPSRIINHMCYSCDDSFLIVAGGPEPVLAIYNHFERKEVANDDRYEVSEETLCVCVDYIESSYKTN